MRVVVVGGVAGGMSFATRFRRLNENAEIIVLDKGPYVSFANCGLPYHIGGEIEDRDDLIVVSPETLKARFQLDIRPNHEVVAIHPDTKTVTVVNDEETFELSYDKLLLSPGAKPIVPPIPGLTESNNVFSLRNLPDMDKIVRHIDNNAPQKAVVIGAGFIGLEMGEVLKHRGLDVTIVEMAPQILAPLDTEMAQFVRDELEANGIQVLVGKGAQEFKNKGQTIILSDGDEIESDLTILSIGVMPDTAIAQEAGIETGFKGGIRIDEFFRTNVQDIYAVGDAVLVKHMITQEETLISLASPANRQGRQAADAMSGLPRKHRGSLGTSILRAFSIGAGSTGLNERQLQTLGYPYESVHITGKNHAGYFPNATAINLKLIFNPQTGAIYGAQAIGEDGVDKRIDVIATAIKGGMTVEDLPELELTYAPPFGTAKDVVNIAGYAALNIVEGYSEAIQWDEVDQYRNQGAYLLDVRDAMEVKEAGALDGFHNIPLNYLRCRLHEIPEDAEVIVACHSGQRSYSAMRVLKQAGYKAKNLDGAFKYQALMHPESVSKE